MMSLKERVEATGPFGRVIGPVLNEILDHLNNDVKTGNVATIYALLTEITTDLNAHMANATAHTNDDDVTTAVATSTVDTKATAIARANLLLAAYEAHRARLEDAAEAAVHGIVDATNVVDMEPLPGTASWAQIDALGSAIKTAYEAHRVLTTGTVHANADSTNAVAADPVGMNYIATLAER